MPYDVSTLGTHVKANEKELVTKAVLEAKTIGILSGAGQVMLGVKSKSQLPNMDTDAVFQDGKACGFTSSGSTKFSAREVEVGSIKVQEALCPKDVEHTFHQLNMKAGSEYTEAIFAKDYAELKGKRISSALEKGVWQGDKASGTANLKRFDGFIKIIDAASDEITGNPTGITAATGITKANVVAILKGVRNAAPIEVRSAEDFRIFAPMEVVDLYLEALQDANLYHYKADEVGSYEVTLHGTTTKIVGVAGLNGTSRIFGMRLSNMWFATDLLNEEESYSLEYAKEAKEVRYDVNFKGGVQVAFTDEVVSFKLVP